MYIYIDFGEGRIYRRLWREPFKMSLWHYGHDQNGQRSRLFSNEPFEKLWWSFHDENLWHYSDQNPFYSDENPFYIDENPFYGDENPFYGEENQFSTQVVVNEWTSCLFSIEAFEKRPVMIIQSWNPLTRIHDSDFYSDEHLVSFQMSLLKRDLWWLFSLQMSPLKRDLWWSFSFQMSLLKRDMIPICILMMIAGLICSGTGCICVYTHVQSVPAKKIFEYIVFGEGCWLVWM